MSSALPPLPRSVLRSALLEIGLPPEDGEALEPLAGDVGARRYFRCRPTDGAPRILAVYPESLRDTCRRFLSTTELLAAAGVRVPRILAADCRAGWAWLEDLGAETLYQRFRDAPDPWDDLLPWYRRALEALEAIRSLPVDEVGRLGNPPLGAGLLRRELARTEEAFFEPRGLPRPGRIFDDLVAEIAAASPVPCHRDFMVRNLVPVEGEGPAALGVLDHQDLRPGPPFYDLASLLNDSLFPPVQVEAELVAASLGGEDDRLLYHRVAAQRTLKVVGTFARTGHHRGLIPATVARARAHLAQIPEAGELPAVLGRACSRDQDLVSSRSWRKPS